jgi:hypothetical protein
MLLYGFQADTGLDLFISCAFDCDYPLVRHLSLVSAGPAVARFQSPYAMLHPRETYVWSMQAVRKTFSARYNPDTSLVDEAELECHHNLQALYNSTRAAKVRVPPVCCL